MCDVNYNRLQTALLLIGGSVAAGALGGLVGGWFGSFPGEPVAEEGPHEWTLINLVTLVLE